MKTKAEFRLNAAACFTWALAVLVLPLRWILAALLAAGVHELCHCAALKACGGALRRVDIGPTGAVLHAEELPAWKGLFCTLAGPAGSLLLLLLAKWMPLTALCGLAQGLYNLLPLFPLDGGRAMRYILELCRIPRGESLARGVEWAVMAGIVCLAVYAALIWKLGMLPLLAAGMLAKRAFLRKIPCNSGFERVQ